MSFLLISPVASILLTKGLVISWLLLVSVSTVVIAATVLVILRLFRSNVVILRSEGGLSRTISALAGIVIGIAYIISVNRLLWIY